MPEAAAFQVLASFALKGRSAQYAIGTLKESACMSTPKASMSASRSSILMNLSGNGPSPPAGVRVRLRYLRYFARRLSVLDHAELTVDELVLIRGTFARGTLRGVCDREKEHAGKCDDH